MDALTAEDIPVSVDSFVPDVQRFAIAHGAAYLNDIQGFPDPALHPKLACADCRLVDERGQAGRYRSRRPAGPRKLTVVRVARFECSE